MDRVNHLDVSKPLEPPVGSQNSADVVFAHQRGHVGIMKIITGDGGRRPCDLLELEKVRIGLAQDLK